MLDERSKKLRRLIIRMVETGRRGHIGPAASLVEILRVLYDSWLNFQPENPRWRDRDRLILSKGHGCLALYAILADKGFFPIEELDRFCFSESFLGGHPEDKIPGVEASTGALGHGLPIGVGMALAGKIRRQEHRVAVIVGDGEINEGSTWEAAMSAAKHNLINLTVLVDYNKYQSYGPTSVVLELEPLADKWQAFGFGVMEVDGHDHVEILNALNRTPISKAKPSLVICHTTKGKGFPMAENRAEWHHKSRLSDADIASLYACLG
ncbi:MAG: transketolase [Dehalococcoidales bacterium]|jgi:transketolase|nr:transketolase [Dehalococcoidales bacterium]|tara:strand:+ start:1185 stop:1982 length:798 start_codon:yes stop_codon:yes gene_type:complete